MLLTSLSCLILDGTSEYFSDFHKTLTGFTASASLCLHLRWIWRMRRTFSDRWSFMLKSETNRKQTSCNVRITTGGLHACCHTYVWHQETTVISFCLAGRAFQNTSWCSKDERKERQCLGRGEFTSIHINGIPLTCLADPNPVPWSIRPPCMLWLSGGKGFFHGQTCNVQTYSL